MRLRLGFLNVFQPWVLEIWAIHVWWWIRFGGRSAWRKVRGFA